MLKFHSARLQTITYLPTEFQAGSFNTLDFYKETDGPTNQPTNRRTTRNIEDLVDPKNHNLADICPAENIIYMTFPVAYMHRNVAQILA